MAMLYFLNDTQELARTFSLIDSLELQENEPYYLRMGVACLSR